MSPDDVVRGDIGLDQDRPHEWYDDEFCSGGDLMVGTAQPQAVCPVCGEMMDVDEDGRLFKHRPRIPADTHEVPRDPE